MKRLKLIRCNFLFLVSGLLLFNSFTLKTTEVPYATINGSIGGTMKASNFMTATQLTINNSNASKCKVHSYSIFYIPINGTDVLEYKLQNAAFSKPVTNTIHQAQKGDKYLFVDVKVSCEGEVQPIKINGLDFHIR